MTESLREQTVVVESFNCIDVFNLKLPIIAIFRCPEDYPDKCVARLFDGNKATNIVVIRDKVEELRGQHERWRCN